MAGGEDADTGTNTVIRSNGETELLSGTATVTLAADDVVIIETPGGGGFGAKE